MITSEQQLLAYEFSYETLILSDEDGIRAWIEARCLPMRHPSAQEV